MTDDTSGYKRIWQALIGVMFADALSKQKNSTAQHQRDVAITWLTTPSSDFAEACHLAGFEPDRVRAKAVALIKSGKIMPRFNRSNNVVRRARPATIPSPQFIEFNGLSLTPKQWADRIGISRQMIVWRINRGWPVERALTEPLRRCPGVVTNIPDAPRDRRGSTTQDSA